MFMTRKNISSVQLWLLSTYWLFEITECANDDWYYTCVDINVNIYKSDD